MRSCRAMQRVLPFFLLTGLAAAAQAAIDPPAGWHVRAHQGGSLFEPDSLPQGTRFELWVGPAVPAGGGRFDAFNRVKNEGLRGIDVAGLKPQCEDATVMDRGAITQACTLQGPGKVPVSLHFMMLPPQGGQAKWFRVVASGDVAALKSQSDTLGTLIAGVTRQLMAGEAVSTPARDKAGQERADREAREAEVERAIRTQAGKGLKPQDLAGVLFSWAQVMRVGGLQYEETVYFLLKDGTAYENPEMPPEDFNADASRQLQPKRWVRWRKQGDKYEVRGADDRDWQKLSGWMATPGRSNERLSQTFTHSSYASYGGMGGYASQKHYRFMPDGRFEQSGYTSMGTGTVQANNGFAAGSYTSTGKNGTQSVSTVSATGGTATDPAVVGGGSSNRRNDGAANTGTYRIDGWTIELHRDNGVVDRKLFLFSRDKRDSVNIGGVGYSVPSGK